MPALLTTLSIRPMSQLLLLIVGIWHVASQALSPIWSDFERHNGDDGWRRLWTEDDFTTFKEDSGEYTWEYSTPAGTPHFRQTKNSGSGSKCSTLRKGSLHYLKKARAPASNYSWNVSVMSNHNHDDDLGIVFRVDDTNNYYIYSADNDNDAVPTPASCRKLYKISNGVRRELWTAGNMPVGEQYTKGTWHEIKVVLNGCHMKGSWDGTPDFDFTDSACVAAGGPGFYVSGSQHVYFKDWHYQVDSHFGGSANPTTTMPITTTTKKETVTTTSKELVYSCSGGSGVNCKTCKPPAQRTSTDHCNTCNDGFYISGTRCQAYSCMSGGGTSCKTCKVQGQRTANGQCATCNSGYMISGTTCLNFACNTIACKTCVSPNLNATGDHCASCWPGFSLYGTRCQAKLLGSMTVQVSNASTFINERSASSAMRRAIADVCEVNVSFIDNVTMTLASVSGRRLAQLLAGATLANEVNVGWRLTIDSGSSTVTLIYDQFNLKTIREATQNIMNVLSAVFGSKYAASVTWKYLTHPAKPVTLPPGSPSEDSDTTTMIFVVLIGVSVVALCLLAHAIRRYLLKLKRKRQPIRFEVGVGNPPHKLQDDLTGDAGHMFEGSLAQLLHVAERIADNDGRLLRQQLRQFNVIGLNHVVQEPDVFISYTLGRRPGDAESCGPGAFYATAVVKSLVETGNLCCRTWETLAHRQWFANSLQGRGCEDKLFVIVETREFYNCEQCLREVFFAQSSRMEFVSLRFEEDLPELDDRWGELRRTDPCAVAMFQTVQSQLVNMASVPERPWTVRMKPESLDFFALQVRDQLQGCVVRETLIAGKTLPDDSGPPFVEPVGISNCKSSSSIENDTSINDGRCIATRSKQVKKKRATAKASNKKPQRVASASEHDRKQYFDSKSEKDPPQGNRMQTSSDSLSRVTPTSLGKPAVPSLSSSVPKVSTGQGRAPSPVSRRKKCGRIGETKVVKKATVSAPGRALDVSKTEPITRGQPSVERREQAGHRKQLDQSK